jgi:hypothetical protein
MHVRTPASLAPLAPLARLGATLACAALATLAGCGSDNPTTGGAPRLSILLTDAPGDVEKAVVTISEIYLQGDGGRVTLRDTPYTGDLLTLANSTAELVHEAEVPAGSYGELRFVVTGGYVEVERDGGGTAIYASSPTYAGLPAGAQVAGELRMPSFAQSGLKVKLPGDGLTMGAEQKIVLVDFDVAQSFGRQAGNSGAWVMHPVLEASEIQAAGGVTVSVTKGASVVLPIVAGAQLGMGNVEAVLTNAAGSAERLPLAETAPGSGVWQARFLYAIPGEFTVDLAAPATVTLTTTEARPAALTLASGASASTSFTLTAVGVTP